MNRTTFIAIIAAGLAAAMPARGQDDIDKQLRLKIKDCKFEQQTTPDFGLKSATTEKRWKPLQWLEFDTEIEIDLARDLGGRDGTWESLEFKYFAGFNQKTKEGKNIVITGTMTYVNIPAKDASHALAYISPATLKKVLQKDNGGKNDVRAFGIEIHAGGKPIAVHSSTSSPWWIDANKQPNGQMFDFQDGGILPKAKTPFAPLWGDYDLLTQQK